jgi:hypothetical protein
VDAVLDKSEPICAEGLAAARKLALVKLAN